MVESAIVGAIGGLLLIVILWLARNRSLSRLAATLASCVVWGAGLAITDGWSGVVFGSLLGAAMGWLGSTVVQHGDLR